MTDLSLASGIKSYVRCSLCQRGEYCVESERLTSMRVDRGQSGPGVPENTGGDFQTDVLADRNYLTTTIEPDPSALRYLVEPD